MQVVQEDQAGTLLRNNLSYQSSLTKVKTKRNTGCLMEGFHNQVILISPQDSEGRGYLTTSQILQTLQDNQRKSDYLFSS